MKHYYVYYDHFQKDIVMGEHDQKLDHQPGDIIDYNEEGSSEKRKMTLIAHYLMPHPMIGTTLFQAMIQLQFPEIYAQVIK